MEWLPACVGSCELTSWARRGSPEQMQCFGELYAAINFLSLEGAYAQFLVSEDSDVAIHCV